MRNEIFARNGYSFKDEMLHEYFSSKDWYRRSQQYDHSALNAFEKTLVEYLQELEPVSP